MSLVDDATTVFNRPGTITCTALTVSVWSVAVSVGICSFRISLTPRTFTVVFGPGCTLTGTATPPTVMYATVASPVPPEQTMCEVDITAPIWIAGMPSTPMPARCTEAFAVEEFGFTAVDTLAHSVPALTRPLMVATHGGALVPGTGGDTGPAFGGGEEAARP